MCYCICVVEVFLDELIFFVLWRELSWIYLKMLMYVEDLFKCDFYIEFCCLECWLLW